MKITSAISQLLLQFIAHMINHGSTSCLPHFHPSSNCKNRWSFLTGEQLSKCICRYVKASTCSYHSLGCIFICPWLKEWPCLWAYRQSSHILFWSNTKQGPCEQHHDRESLLSEALSLLNFGRYTLDAFLKEKYFILKHILSFHFSASHWDDLASSVIQRCLDINS